MTCIQCSCCCHRNAKNHAHCKEAVNLVAQEKNPAIIQLQSVFPVHKILGIKMIKPIIKAVTEATSTAPAAMSLTDFI